VGLAFDASSGTAAQTVFATDTAGLFYRFATGLFADAEPAGSTGRAGFSLSSPVPNPAASRARLELLVDQQADPTLTVVDAAGTVHFSNTLGPVTPGRHVISLDVPQLPSGLYYVVVDDDRAGRAIRPIMILK
jgi:hypothetical protein